MGGVGRSKKDPLFFVKDHESFVFLDLSPKSVSACRLHGVCMGRSGTSADTFHALFSHFCYVVCFGDLGDPVLPTVRGVCTHCERNF